MGFFFRKLIALRLERGSCIDFGFKSCFALFFFQELVIELVLERLDFDEELVVDFARGLKFVVLFCFGQSQGIAFSRQGQKRLGGA